MYKSWMWKQRSYREQFEAGEGGSGASGSAATADDGQAGGAGQPEGETSQGGQEPAGEGAGSQAAADDEELVITLGEEAPPSEEDEQLRAAPAWVKELRKSDREKAKRIREQEAEIARLKGAATQQPQQIQVGAKPTLESCDFDAEAYAEKLLAWNDRKRQADEQAAAARQAQEQAQAAWQKKLDGYKAAGAALKVSDFDDAEHTVRETLSDIQQSILISGADNPAALVYALGKHPAEAKKLAAIKDPVKYAFAVAKLETQLKVTPRKAAPAPERKVTGGAGGATGVDNQLERLRAEADRTGDRSKVAAYLRQQKQAA